MEVKLGSNVKDNITGFEGVATGKCEYLNGCVQYEITASKLEDGKPVEKWFDEGRVILVAVAGEKRRAIEEKPPGGPRNHPIRRNPSTSGT